MSAPWGRQSGWYLRLVWEEGAADFFHIVLDDPADQLLRTLCGRGDPHGGAWGDLLNPSDLTYLGQLCCECVRALAAVAAPVEQEEP
jgi:hypothetical protein